LVFECGAPGLVATGVLHEFEPGIDVMGKDTLLALIGWELPDFVDLRESVSEGDGLLDFGCAKGPSEGALLGSMRVVMGFLQERFGYLFFHTSESEWEAEFALV